MRSLACVRRVLGRAPALPAAGRTSVSDTRLSDTRRGPALGCLCRAEGGPRLWPEPVASLPSGCSCTVLAQGLVGLRVRGSR